MKQMRQNHSDMRTLEASGPFDEAKTRSLATQNAQTMIELQVQHARIKSEMMQVLTADQKTKLAEFEAKRDARMSKHMPPPPRTSSLAFRVSLPSGWERNLQPPSSPGFFNRR